MRTRAGVIVLAIAVGGLCGCGTVPQSKYYQLTAPGEASSAAAGDPLPVTVLVGPLKASHLYREDRLVYATDSEEMGTYQVHRWAEPPTEMMQELLWRSLRASRRFSAVYLLTQQLSRRLSAARESVRFQGNFRQHARGPREYGTWNFARSKRALLCGRTIILMMNP